VEENLSNPRKNALLIGGAFLIACGIVFGAYHSVLNSGFLLDDFKHLGYAYSANHGDPSGLLRTFAGNWTGQTDGLTSFRPGISLSFWFDNLLFGLNPVGYHVTNLVMFSGCTFLCGLLAYQLAADAPHRQRLLTGTGAMILFALYPIHAESVSWIIGRVDVHCTFFYLLSLSLYLQFRKAGSIAFFGLSLVFFLASLVCKEMAVTLPVVIALAELFLSAPLNWQIISIRKKLVFVGSFFVALGAFGLLRTLLIGTVVGGYGDTSLRSFFRAFRNNFFDGATFSKILFGVNEEQPFPLNVAQTALAAWIVVAISLITRLIQPIARVRVMAFLFLWLIVAELPTFQIWHIFPNLVGSRLFFLGSAAMCLLLAVTLIPTFKMIGKFAGDGYKNIVKFNTFVGVGSLIVLTICWYLGLSHNLFPWIEAGRQMQSANEKLLSEARSTPEGRSVVLIDLPQDYSGAGMIGRPELLDYMLTKPVADGDYAKKFVSLVRPIPGPIEYIYPNLLATTYGDPQARKFLHWDKDVGSYVDWMKPGGSQTVELTEFPPDDSFQKKKQKPKKDGAARRPPTIPGTVANPATPVNVWLSKDFIINPLAVGALEIEISSSLELSQLAHNARLVWRSERQPKSWIDYSEGPFAEVRDGRLLFMPGRYRSWALNGAIGDIGIQFLPGQYSAEVKSVKNVSTSTLAPSLELISESKESSYESKNAFNETKKLVNENSALSSLQNKILPIVHSGDSVNVSYNASAIPGAKTVFIVVTKTDIACPDLPVTNLPDDSQLVLKQPLANVTGTFRLPADALAQKGKHQVAIIGINGDGKPAGYISEPRTFFVAD